MTQGKILHNTGEPLMMTDNVVATNLILANVYHDVPLIMDAQPAATGATSPFALSPTLWDPKEVRLPVKDPDQEEVSLKISQEDSTLLDDIADNNAEDTVAL